MTLTISISYDRPGQKKACPSRSGETRFEGNGQLDLGQSGDVLHQAALEVCSLVLMDIMLLGQTVDHRNHLGQENLGFVLFGHGSQVLDGRTGAFLVKPVTQTTNCNLTPALLGGLMVCHIPFS